MNIQSDYNCNYNISMYGGLHTNKPKLTAWKKLKNKIKQRALDLIPERTLLKGQPEIDRYEKINAILSRPDVNRSIMGGTAVVTQPVIDRTNHRVDEETRKVSMYRTLAKIIAGTTVGVLVRGSCYKLVTKMTDINSAKKYSKALLPKAWIERFAKNMEHLSNYKSTLSTFMALGIMLFTNFLLDAPLTVFLTNKFTAADAKAQKRREAA